MAITALAKDNRAGCITEKSMKQAMPKNTCSKELHADTALLSSLPLGLGIWNSPRAFGWRGLQQGQQGRQRHWDCSPPLVDEGLDEVEIVVHNLALGVIAGSHLQEPCTCVLPLSWCVLVRSADAGVGHKSQHAN